MSYRLQITDISATDDGILIKKMQIIDSDTGDIIRIAKLTPQLAELLKQVEIDTTLIMLLDSMKEKNPSITKLVDTFRLFT